MVIRHKSTGKTLIRQKSIHGLYPVSIEDLLKLGDGSSAAVAGEELPVDHQNILGHRRLDHVHNDKLIESDRRGLVEGINQDRRYFKRSIKRQYASATHA